MQPKVKSVAIYNVLPKEIMTAKTFIFRIIECFLRQKKKNNQKKIYLEMLESLISSQLKIILSCHRVS